MRLHEIRVKNFRKLKDCTIKFRATTFLIGPNNSGKSSVFAALEHFHKNTNVDREDFLKIFDAGDSDYHYKEEIEIVAEYHNLPDEASAWMGFRGRIINNPDHLEGETNNKIVYKKTWKMNQTKPKVYMLEYNRSVNPIYGECSKVEDLVGEHYDELFIKSFFGEANLTKSLGIAAVKTKLQDLSEYWLYDANQEPQWIENPGGIPQNVLSKLPQVVIIPAESGINELNGKSGVLQTLLGLIFEKVRSQSDNYQQAQSYLNRLAEEMNPSDLETDFGRLINELNSMAHSLFPEATIHVTASLDQPDKVIKPIFSIEMESNVKTAINYQGHGLIRATVFQLLRFYQDFMNRSEEMPRTTLFCFEEPEIYLHPSAANQMRDLLFELAGLSCQIIATTHSPYMINLGSEKSVSLVKFALDNEELAVCSSFNLESAFQSLQRDEKQNLKMLLKIDDYISRLFFSKKCIFIEGDTEDIIIRETNRRLNDVDKARVIGNCEFLRARGKAVLISVAKYLNALEINYMIMHDRDAGTERAEAMNDPILEQTGENRRIMVEECIENIIGYDAPTYEKPFKAYKYIEENWGDTFDELPQAWRVIFLKLCSPYLDHLIQNN